MKHKVIAFWLAFLILSIPYVSAKNAASEEVPAVQEIADRIKSKMKRGALFIFGIEKKLGESKDELQLLKNNVKTLEERIVESNIKVFDLKSQLGNLNQLAFRNQEKINAIELQIAVAENEVLVLGSDTEALNDALNGKTDDLNELILTAYFQANALFDISTNRPRLLALLSDQHSIGNAFRKHDYLLFLEQATQDAAHSILKSQEIMDEKKGLMREKKERLSSLQALLAREKRALKDSEASKKRLLEETNGRQVVYETLLEISKREISNVGLQIERLRDNYDFFQKKLDELKNDKTGQIFNEEINAEGNAEAFRADTAPLSWPVSPNLGISAFFDDSDYEKALGVKHWGIDIRIPQGSKVRAAADGVVSKVIDNGFAYSYVIIAHAGKILTLYGHLSEILVKEGEIVRDGQLIGLSGGIPGTKGAGWLTTGAHVHFEVFENFKHADPLDYLPLELAPLSSLPEKHLKHLTEVLSLRQNR